MTISVWETYWIHISLFVMGGSSILNLGLLSIDRALALLKPHKHRKGLREWKTGILLFSTWIASGFMIKVYLHLGYIKTLMIYTSTTVMFSAACLIFVTIAHRKKLRPHQTVETCTSEEAIHWRLSKRVNSSFTILLLLFLVTYIPAGLMIIYMNSCHTRCNCLLIHVSRDLTYLLILSGALLRSTYFICRVSTIRRAAIETIFNKNERSTSELDKMRCRTQTESESG